MPSEQHPDPDMVNEGTFPARVLGMPWTWSALTTSSSVSVPTMVAERWRLLRLLVHGRGATVMLIGCEVLLALRQAAVAVAVGWLVGSVELAAQSGTASGVVTPLIVFGVLVVGLQGVSSIQEAMASDCRLRIDGWVRQAARLAANTQPTLVELSDAEFQADVTRTADLGRRSGRTRSVGAATVGQLTFTMRVLGGVLTAGVLAQFSVVVAVAVFVLCLLNRSVLRRQWMHLASAEDGRGGIRRQVDYWTDLASDPRVAGEVRLFGLGPWIVMRNRRAAIAERGPLLRDKLAVMRQQVVIVGLTLAAAVVGMLPVSVAGVRGDISAAELMACLTAAAGMIFTLSSMGHEAFDIEYGRGSLAALERLQASAEQSSRPTHAAPEGTVVAFDGVSFAYPGQGHLVLDGCQLAVRSGEVLGVVGPNGAGKTTLVKMMAGLLDPTDGAVGRGTSGAVGASAVFQDLIHYPLSLRENIALGAPEVEATDERVMESLRAADADRLVEGLPHGLDTVLQRDMAGGTDLSGGQWQRIAIARAIYAVHAGRELIILDEPTANLDVRAEAAFYETVVRSLPGATVVLISHRLSTVRHADRIVMLAGGRITEEGTHNDLIAARGEYARLFDLQASRFHGEVVQ